MWKDQADSFPQSKLDFLQKQLAVLVPGEVMQEIANFIQNVQLAQHNKSKDRQI